MKFIQTYKCGTKQIEVVSDSSTPLTINDENGDAFVPNSRAVEMRISTGGSGGVLLKPASHGHADKPLYVIVEGTKFKMTSSGLQQV